MSFVVPPNRILPLHGYDTDNTSINTPHAVVQSITMGIRIGSMKYAIGAIHKFSFRMERDARTVYQIEPYPNVRGDSTSPSAFPNGFDSLVFDENTTYWPGEAIEVIPGKMGQINVTLDRYVLYTANLMAALLRATGGGVYDSQPVAPNKQTSESGLMQYVSILQQVRPFDVYQFFVSPITGKVLWGRKFGGCWIRSLGETSPESDRNEAILENGEMVATYIRPLSSSLPT